MRICKWGRGSSIGVTDLSEQFDVAAIRHFEAGEHLEQGGHLDDAGYHYGISGENALKSAMREAGLEQYWLALGQAALRKSPMRGHWAELSNKVIAASSEITLFASGRRANALRALASAAAPSFDGWSIDIRYASAGCVPVAAASLAAWKGDASRFVSDFVVV